MRNTSGHRLRGAGQSIGLRAGLGLERLEGRLTLNHGPLVVAPAMLLAPEGPDYRPAESRGTTIEMHGPSFDVYAPSRAPFGERDLHLARGEPGFDLHANPQLAMPQIQFVWIIEVVNFSFSPTSPPPSRVEAPPRGRVETSTAGPQTALASVALPPGAEARGTGDAQGAAALASALAAVAPTVATQLANVPIMLPNRAELANSAPVSPPAAELPLAPPQGDLLNAPPAVAPRLGADAVPTDDSRTSPPISEAEPADAPPAANAEPAPRLAGVSFNVEAIDQAFRAVFSEVEEVGGELVSWLDDLSWPSAAAVAATAALVGAGGHYLLKVRGRRLRDEQNEEESSSWLFTRFQSP